MGLLDDGGTTIAMWLVLLFISSMGEAYFPDIMKINGFKALSNWLFVADALGNMGGAFVPTAESWKDVPARKAIVPALCDAVSKMFILGGLALSSAQIKSILYNSCIVFSALLSRLVMGRILAPGQWAGVAVLVCGLLAKIEFKNGGDAADKSSALIPIGMVSILIGCALHSLTNVVNEYYIRVFKFPPPKLCCLVGCSNLTLWTLLVAIGFIIPEKEGDNPFGHVRRDYINMTAFGGTNELTPMSNAVAWGGFVLSSAIHAVAYYSLLGSIGVVSCGVMKGLTTAGYVALSVILLCNNEVADLKGYCMTQSTVISSVLCVIGVLIYSVFSAKAQQQPQQPAGDMAESVQGAEEANQKTEVEMGRPFTAVS